MLVSSPWILRWFHRSQSFDNNASPRTPRVPEKTHPAGSEGRWEAMNSCVEARYSHQMIWREDLLKREAASKAQATEEEKESYGEENVPESFRARIAVAAVRRRREVRARVDKDSDIFSKKEKDNADKDKRREKERQILEKDRDSGCYSGSSEGETQACLDEQKQVWNKLSEVSHERRFGRARVSTGPVLMDSKFSRGGNTDERGGWSSSSSTWTSPPPPLRTGDQFPPPRSLQLRSSGIKYHKSRQNQRVYFSSSSSSVNGSDFEFVDGLDQVRRVITSLKSYFSCSKDVPSATYLKRPSSRIA